MVPGKQVQVNTDQLMKGDVVTFSYSGHSRNAIPINPFIFKIRTDLSWQLIMANFLRDTPLPLSNNGMMLLQ